MGSNSRESNVSWRLRDSKSVSKFWAKKKVLPLSLSLLVSEMINSDDTLRRICSISGGRGRGRDREIWRGKRVA